MDVLEWVSLAICIESCLFITTLYGLDTHKRVSKELKREKWKDPVKAWPRPVWWFVTANYILFVITIIISYFVNETEYIHYIFALLLTFSIQPDWYQMELQSQYIRGAYDKLSERSSCFKYWSAIICIIGTIITITVYIIYCIFNVNDIINISLSLFIIIQLSISLLLMIAVGTNFYYHARIGHLNAVTTLRAGKRSYFAYFERFYYYLFYYWIRVICHLVLITVFALDEALDIEVSDDICIVFGLVLQFWFFGSYYLFVPNRCKLNKYTCCKLCTNIWDNWAEKSYQDSKTLILQSHPSEIGAL